MSSEVIAIRAIFTHKKNIPQLILNPNYLFVGSVRRFWDGQRSFIRFNIQLYVDCRIFNGCLHRHSINESHETSWNIRSEGRGKVSNVKVSTNSAMNSRNYTYKVDICGGDEFDREKSYLLHRTRAFKVEVFVLYFVLMLLWTLCSTICIFSS